MSNSTEMRHICLISGGKDSTALALYMRDNHPELPMEYVFSDTRKELEETYDYLTKIEAYLGQPIVRLTSELGDRGFDHHLTVFNNYLPSPQIRWCTRKLKIEPFEDYVGDEPAYLYIGIRADEQRDGYISTKPNLIPIYPFREDGINRDDVFRMLEDSGVGIPDYYQWRSRSGCYFCFFQRKVEWVGLLENHPELYEKARAYEKTEEGFTWQQGESLDDIAKPERIKQIRENHEKRQQQMAARRKPKTLLEMFTGEYEEEDDQGCLICHL